MLPTPQLLNQVANFIQGQGKFSYYGLFLLGKEAGLRVSEAVNFNLNLKNAKESLERELIQTQQEKDTLLKLLSAELQVQHDNLLKQDSEKLSNQELHQQLIAQIQVLTKN